MGFSNFPFDPICTKILNVPLNFYKFLSEANESNILSFCKGLKYQNYNLMISRELINIFVLWLRIPNSTVIYVENNKKMLVRQFSN